MTSLTWEALVGGTSAGLVELVCDGSGNDSAGKVPVAVGSGSDSLSMIFGPGVD